jgi:hypothetical protein
MAVTSRVGSEPAAGAGGLRTFDVFGPATLSTHRSGQLRLSRATLTARRDHGAQ